MAARSALESWLRYHDPAIGRALDEHPGELAPEQRQEIGMRATLLRETVARLLELLPELEELALSDLRRVESGPGLTPWGVCGVCGGEWSCLHAGGVASGPGVSS
jgi:hypothetical protein